MIIYSKAWLELAGGGIDSVSALVNHDNVFRHRCGRDRASGTWINRKK
jgi:hypothetical protein